MVLPFRRKPLAPSTPPPGSKLIAFGESTFEFTGTVTLNGVSTTGPYVSTALAQRFGWLNLNTGNHWTVFIPSTVSAGNFTVGLTVNGGTIQTTGNQAWNVSVASLQTALTGLSNIGAGNLLVTAGTISGGTAYILTPIGSLATAALQVTFTSVALSTPVFSPVYIWAFAAGVSGNYTFSWNPGTGSVTSANVAVGAAANDGTAASVTAKLAAMSNIGAGNVRVIGSGTVASPYVLFFQNTLFNNQPAPTINNVSLSPATIPVLTPYNAFQGTDPPLRAAVGSTVLQTHSIWSATDTRPNVTGAGAYVARVTQFNPDVIVAWYCANEYINSTATGAANPITAVRFAAAWDTVLAAFNALASKPTIVVAGMQPLSNPLSAYSVSVPDWSNFPASDALGSRDVIDQYDQIMRAKAAQYGATYVYLRDLPAALMQGDGVHPTDPAGLQWVADRIATAF